LSVLQDPPKLSAYSNLDLVDAGVTVHQFAEVVSLASVRKAGALARAAFLARVTVSDVPTSTLALFATWLAH
jgi:hypothetical protein